MVKLNSVSSGCYDRLTHTSLSLCDSVICTNRSFSSALWLKTSKDLSSSVESLLSGGFCPLAITVSLFVCVFYPLSGCSSPPLSLLPPCYSLTHSSSCTCFIILTSCGELTNAGRPLCFSVSLRADRYLALCSCFWLH